jgi:hypothetical protein
LDYDVIELWVLFAAWRYLNSPSLFAFDVVTSVPFSYYDLAIYEVLNVNVVCNDYLLVHWWCCFAAAAVDDDLL